MRWGAIPGSSIVGRRHHLAAFHLGSRSSKHHPVWHHAIFSYWLAALLQS
jgi:hypothetical protein